jgi:hypothetical protein
MSSCRVHADFPAGKTTQIQLGGKGRPVVGKLEPPKGFDGKVLWQFALIEVQTYVPDLPPPAKPPIPADIDADPVKRAAWMLQWQQTDEGKIYLAWGQAMQSGQQARDAGPYFFVTVARDGAFRIDDMPTGDFSLSVRFDNNDPAGHIRNYHFAVPPMDGDRSDEKLDLGTIRLDK